MIRKSRVLINSIYSPPEIIGIAKYTGEKVEYLIETNKFQVSLVTSAPYYPDWVTWKGFSNKKWVKEKKEGIVTYRVPYFIPKRLTGGKKMLHLLSYSLSAFPLTFWQIIKFKPDVVIILYPYIFTGLYTIILTKIFRPKCKIWTHVQDFELDAAFDLNLIKSKIIKKLGLFAEKMIFKHSDISSSISENM